MAGLPHYLIQYRDDLNIKIVKAVLEGSMERKIYWAPSEVYELQKKISYLEKKILQEQNLQAEKILKGRLEKFKKALENFDYQKMAQRYVTLLEIADLPSVGYLYSRELFSTEVFFNVFIIDKLMYQWEVEKSNCGQYSHREMKYSTRNPEDKMANMLYTLPALITPEYCVRDLSDVPRYRHEFK